MRIGFFPRFISAAQRQQVIRQVSATLGIAEEEIGIINLRSEDKGDSPAHDMIDAVFFDPDILCRELLAEKIKAKGGECNYHNDFIRLSEISAAKLFPLSYCLHGTLPKNPYTLVSDLDDTLFNRSLFDMVECIKAMLGDNLAQDIIDLLSKAGLYDDAKQPALSPDIIKIINQPACQQARLLTSRPSEFLFIKSYFLMIQEKIDDVVKQAGDYYGKSEVITKISDMTRPIPDIIDMIEKGQFSYKDYYNILQQLMGVLNKILKTIKADLLEEQETPDQIKITRILHDIDRVLHDIDMPPPLNCKISMHELHKRLESTSPKGILQDPDDRASIENAARSHTGDGSGMHRPKRWHIALYPDLYRNKDEELTIVLADDNIFEIYTRHYAVEAAARIATGTTDDVLDAINEFSDGDFLDILADFKNKINPEAFKGIKRIQAITICQLYESALAKRLEEGKIRITTLYSTPGLNSQQVASVKSLQLRQKTLSMFDHLILPAPRRQTNVCFLPGSSRPPNYGIE